MSCRRRTPPRAQRLWRGGVLASCSAALAVAAHGVASGHAPNAGVTIGVALLVGWAGTSLAGARRGMPAVLGILGVAQLAQHTLLTFLAEHGEPARFGGWLMLAAHAIAVGVTAWLLTRADTASRTASSAVSLLVGWLARVCLTVPAPAFTAVAPPAPNRPGRLVEVLLRRVHGRRGPPVLS
ncbi:hypothetical protein [Herbihabitans rhizosphaerae]|uniref:hypothetical protein n=1 Tax=Herbihabitans rhizosphaerae TaxID=1872711 RepID=UPI00102C9C12|nr:hypothetical protein [Herbihabitans rhizosphaerae]